MSRQSYLSLLSRQGIVILSLGLATSVIYNSSLGVRAEGAEWTEVADSAEEGNPFDFIGEVFYRRHLRRAKITREYNCNPYEVDPSGQFTLKAQADQGTCPGAPSQGEIISVKELRYARYTHEIVPRARFGLYQDLELWIEAPIVVEDTQEVRFAGDGGDPEGIPVTPEISSISRVDSAGPYQQLFSVPAQGLMTGLPRRAGFGDMLFKLRYAPISHERDITRGEWVLELGYRAPTGSVMRPRPESTGGVGRGVHELVFSTAFSKRYNFVEPYARFEANIPLGSTIDSPFKDYWGSQDYILPGARGSFDIGAELIPYDNPQKHVKVFISLGLGAGYQAEGRDYSELFDALALGAISCNVADTKPDGRQNCSEYNSNARPREMAVAQAPQIFDGVTTVEDFITVRGHIGFGIYASEYFKIGADISLAHETQHNLSNAEIGKDLFSEGDQRGVFVPALNNEQSSEHNPTFVPAIDTIGQRLRIEETTVFSASAFIGLMF